MRHLAIFALLLVLPACNTPPPLVGDDILVAPVAGQGIQLEMVTTLDPAQEIERCQFFQAPPEGLWVNAEVVRYTPGSHHVLLFSTRYQTIPRKTTGGEERDTRGVFDCKNGAAAEWDIDGVIGGSQSAEGPATLTLPEGVAIHVPGGAVLLMNAHYLNASGAKVKATARMNLVAVPRDTVTDEAGVLFWYNFYIRVPALGTAEARMRCPITRDATLLNVQSHMHRRGVGYQADLLDPSGTVVERLYENDHWENVPIRSFSPGKALSAGQRIDYRCRYENGENRTVVQGLKTSDEMCMLVGTYYPRDRQLELCALDDSFWTSDLAAVHVGSGTVGCAETEACLRAVPMGDTGEGIARCIEASCPKIADPLGAYERCRMEKSPEACGAELAVCRNSAC